MHLVHYKKTYKSFAEASKYPDGLAVFAIFFDANPYNYIYPPFEVIQHKIKNVQKY